MEETGDDPTEAQERGAETGRWSLQPQQPLQPRGVIAHLIHDQHSGAPTGPPPDLATEALLNRVAALEEQLNGLNGPLFQLLTTPEPGMAPHLQDVISGAESEACLILGEHGRLTGLPQVSHTLSEAIYRVQIAQRTLIHMRGMTEHPTPHQDGGAPPRAEELLGWTTPRTRGT